jgi:hypothetical protein
MRIPIVFGASAAVTGRAGEASLTFVTLVVRSIGWR